MNSEEYQQILNDKLLSYLNCYHQFPHVFQQDNATMHVSQITKDWFEHHHIDVLDWPVCSPNCNPIKNLQGILVHCVYANNHQLTLIQELKDEILHCWTAIEPETIQNLVKNMNNRVFEFYLKKLILK